MATLAARFPVPKTPEAWLSEIARAWHDAHQATPFMMLTGLQVKDEDLFQLAPIVCMKFRGLMGNTALLQKATDAALSSVVASSENATGASSEMVFAFSYLASHVGANLLDEDAASGILELVEENEDRLKRLIGEGPRA